jgi:hypothetical protein
MAHSIRAGNGRLPHAQEGKCGRPLRGGSRKGQPCLREAGAGTDHLGEGACYLHGGRSLRGAAHPAFKHGRYSKHWASVGEKLEQAITDLASDPDYLQLRRHIATLDALFLQELAALDADIGGGGWDKARALGVDIGMALRSGNVAGVTRALKQLQALSDSGMRRDKSLARVQSLLRDRVNTTRADQARVEAEKAYATVDQLKDIALMSATSVASQLDLFTRQLMALLSEPERQRIREPFDTLRRATLQGVSESFRRALTGRTPTPPGNGAGLAPEDAVIVVEAVEPAPAPTQAPTPGPGPSRGGGASRAVGLPGLA